MISQLFRQSQLPLFVGERRVAGDECSEPPVVALGARCTRPPATRVARFDMHEIPPRKQRPTRPASERHGASRRHCQQNVQQDSVLQLTACPTANNQLAPVVLAFCRPEQAVRSSGGPRNSGSLSRNCEEHVPTDFLLMYRHRA